MSKRIEEFPNYSIDRNGVITNLTTKQQVKWSYRRSNWPTVTLYRDGKAYERSVAILITTAYGNRAHADIKNELAHERSKHHGSR